VFSLLARRLGAGAGPVGFRSAVTERIDRLGGDGAERPFGLTRARVEAFRGFRRNPDLDPDSLPGGEGARYAATEMRWRQMNHRSATLSLGTDSCEVFGCYSDVAHITGRCR